MHPIVGGGGWRLVYNGGMRFQDCLKRKRIAVGLSQERLAEEMGVSRQTISKWENGDSYPSTKHILMLAEILKCGIGGLVKDDDVGEKSSLAKKTDGVLADSKDVKKVVRIKPRLIYAATSVAVMLLMILCGVFGALSGEIDFGMDKTKLAVFDRLVDGTVDNVADDFAKDGFKKTKVAGYGVDKSGARFFVKYDVVKCETGEPCVAIVYFCEDGTYECCYFDDLGYWPEGEYYEIS